MATPHPPFRDALMDPSRRTHPHKCRVQARQTGRPRRSASLAALFAAALLAPSLAQADEPTDPTIMTVTQIVGAIKDGTLTAREVVEAHLSEAQEHADLNAMISLNTDGALAAADAIDKIEAEGGDAGPLAGVPIVVKDNVNSEGIATTAGTPGLESFVPAANAPVLQALIDAGAILLGKTNMHELAFGITSNNAAFGAVANAAAPDRFAGGSSGGTAAAVAAGIAPAGLGTDTGGSVRIPAALNGLTGLRPTTGRYPQEGMVPISTTRDTAGPMAHSVTDVALLDAVITGEDALEPVDLSTVRLGVPKELAGDVSEGVGAAFESAIESLEEAGVTIIHVEMGEILELNQGASFPIALYEVKRDLTAFLAEYAPDTSLEAVVAEIASPDVKGVFDNAVMGENAMPEAAYRAAMDEARPAMQAAFAALLEDNDLNALAFPTTPLEAQSIEGSDEEVVLNGKLVPTFPTFIRNTDPGSVIGVPGLTIPIGTGDAGLPVGLELEGAAGSDRSLLALGLAVEAVVGE